MADNYGPPPVRGAQHERLDVLVGRWRAEGWSHGSGERERWVSEEVTEWHPGKFFLVQREDATIGSSSQLITHAVIGFDEATQEHYSHAFENHGFYRRYVVKANGNIWMFTGELERARIEISADGNTQQVTWEWRPRDDRWVPLCERTNRRVG